ncbi:MAG: M48 family metalloprotease, partial [Candidatus Aenigmarchaeota archaeon]|nr:M48 family metalloprotease [Candidatus Aenigmarchaeota archaeon]
MKNPRMGVIYDGAPNAFTYGHTPNNARVVLTRGLMDLLNEDEVKGVVAHEIGHAKHWDMLIMTAAQLVPLILYYIYRTL